MHSPTIMVIGETKVSGERAKRISNRINLDGAIFANFVGLFAGLWVLWDFNQVEIDELASTKQEVHVYSETSLASFSHLC